MSGMLVRDVKEKVWHINHRCQRACGASRKALRNTKGFSLRDKLGREWSGIIA